jgi:hypothetical protein
MYLFSVPQDPLHWRGARRAGWVYPFELQGRPTPSPLQGGESVLNERIDAKQIPHHCAPFAQAHRFDADNRLVCDRVLIHELSNDEAL